MSTPQPLVIPSAVARTLTTSATASPSTPRAVTASKKQLSISPHVSIEKKDDSSSEESECEMEGYGCRLFELDGLKSVFQGIRCGECGEKGLV